MKREPTEPIIASGSAGDIKRESARRTRRSFLVGGVASAAAMAAAYYVDQSPADGRLQSALRHTLDFDAAVNRRVFDERGLAPTYPVSSAIPLRLNGVIGLKRRLDLASWRLQLVGTRNPQASPLFARDVGAWEYRYGVDTPDSGQAEDVKSALNPAGASDSAAAVSITEQFRVLAKSMQSKRKEGDAEAGPSYSSLDNGTPGLLLAMDDLARELPRVEFVTQFKCIEGWSNITQWSGFRLRDLLDLCPPQTVNGRDPRYVYMETPDGNFYGGYDLAAARHPQSLLVTHMHGEPLAQEHGAPLRLCMPIKYGYKQLKRIGLISYTDRKPDDYWTKLGYDWYAGL